MDKLAEVNPNSRSTSKVEVVMEEVRSERYGNLMGLLTETGGSERIVT